jgi:hypothetical protein
MKKTKEEGDMTDEMDLDGVQDEVLPVLKPFSTLGDFFIRPRRTIRAITLNEKAIWLLPLALLMLTAFVLTLVTASIENQSNQGFDMPSDMDYYPDYYQDRFSEAASVSGGFASRVLLPTLLRWAGIWINWALLAVLIMIFLMAGGHSLEWRNVFNLIGWSMLPFFVRDLVQAAYMLSSQTLISQPGLSGFLAADGSNFTAYLIHVFALIDIYVVLQIILITMGLRRAVHLKPIRAFLMILISIILLLLIRGVPSYLLERLSGIFNSSLPNF